MIELHTSWKEDGSGLDTQWIRPRKGRDLVLQWKKQQECQNCIAISREAIYPDGITTNLQPYNFAPSTI